MNKVLLGIVHGRTIELDADPGIADGRKVEVVLRFKQPPGPPPGWKPGGTETAAGMMADHWSEADDEILEQIYQDRKHDSRREPAP
ncbi:MAG: hypothetical protein NTY19_43490 [Planctomycetota bacterium]|nr:hypothetical protein [Planctomycetota bacterium]